MKKNQNIFLVGPMGAGKTTVGRMLARDLQRDFFDSDLVIEERTGVDVAWIFDVEGEDGFRQREESIIDELTQRTGVVLATGGGAVLSSTNRTNLAARGIVLYLRVDIEQQLERTLKDKKRPLLQAEDKPKRLQELAAERDNLYREISDYVFNTDERSPKSVVLEIIEALSQENLA